MPDADVEVHVTKIIPRHVWDGFQLIYIKRNCCWGIAIGDGIELFFNQLSMSYLSHM